MHIVDIAGSTWTHSYPVDTVQVRGIEFELLASNDRLKSWSRYFENVEPELLDWIDEFDADSVYFDIGASIGHFSLYAAIQRSAKVFCFEPEAQNFATLEFNNFLNRPWLPTPLRAFNIALSNTKTVGEIVIAHYGAGEHQKSLSSFTRHNSESTDTNYRQSALCFPSDVLRAEFNLPQPHYVKIDVDGSELAALEGARSCLSHGDCRGLFIELDENDKNVAETRALIQNTDMKLKHKFPVKRGRGGYYDGLFNYVFTR